MSAAITIQLDDGVTLPLAKAHAALAQEARPAIGRAVVRLIQDHLFKLNDTRPNRLGGTRTNFYAAAANSTHYTVQETDVVVSISKIGIRQRFLGGTIRPKNISKITGRPIRYLTVPAIAEAHGRTASESNFLHVVFGRGGKPVALAEAPRSDLSFGRKRKDGTSKVSGALTGGRVWYWLVTSVTQAPDPTVLPPEDTIQETAQQAVRTAVAEAMQRPIQNEPIKN